MVGMAVKFQLQLQLQLQLHLQLHLQLARQTSSVTATMVVMRVRVPMFAQLGNITCKLPTCVSKRTQQWTPIQTKHAQLVSRASL